MSIRDRLTIVYSGIFLGAFLVFAIVVYAFPRNLLLVEVDASLEEVAEDILAEARVLNRRDVYSLLVTRRTSNVFEQATTFVMVLDGDGVPLGVGAGARDLAGARGREGAVNAPRPGRFV